MSGHVGDMDDLATLTAFERAGEHLRAVTGVRPEMLIADRHPGYRSAGWAERHRGDRPLIKVQHHHAHVASAMAENRHPVDEPVIGVAFDGTGYGDDGAVWGGEVLIADYRDYRRAAHLRYTLLPGGDAGVRNPCRMALSHLRSAGLDWDPRLPAVADCAPAERAVLSRQLETGLNSMPTSSMGRLFDAMSSLAGVCHRVAYEAEAAMRFEGLARQGIDQTRQAYAFALGTGEMIIADPTPVLRAATEDIVAGAPPMIIAAGFHRAVADLVTATAVELRRRTMINTVALSGGVFLNVLLTRLCVRSLGAAGFSVLHHHQVPPSDAGLALGQLVVGASSRERRSTCA
jgi:hydrogenase maturation protein HypF